MTGLALLPDLVGMGEQIRIERRRLRLRLGRGGNLLGRFLLGRTCGGLLGRHVENRRAHVMHQCAHQQEIGDQQERDEDMRRIAAQNRAEALEAARIASAIASMHAAIGSRRSTSRLLIMRIRVF